MADLQKTSQVVGQLEWDQSDPTQRTSQVVGQVEWDQSDPKQFVSQIVGQVECLHIEDIPIKTGASISIVT